VKDLAAEKRRFEARQRKLRSRYEFVAKVRTDPSERAKRGWETRKLKNEAIRS